MKNYYVYLVLLSASLAVLPVQALKVMIDNQTDATYVTKLMRNETVSEVLVQVLYGKSLIQINILDGAYTIRFTDAANDKTTTIDVDAIRRFSTSCARLTLTTGLYPGQPVVGIIAATDCQ